MLASNLPWLLASTRSFWCCTRVTGGQPHLKLSLTSLVLTLTGTPVITPLIHCFPAWLFQLLDITVHFPICFTQSFFPLHLVQNTNKFPYLNTLSLTTSPINSFITAVSLIGLITPTPPSSLNFRIPLCSSSPPCSPHVWSCPSSALSTSELPLALETVVLLKLPFLPSLCLHRPLIPLQTPTPFLSRVIFVPLCSILASLSSLSVVLLPSLTQSQHSRADPHPHQVKFDCLFIYDRSLTTSFQTVNQRDLASPTQLCHSTGVWDHSRIPYESIPLI